MPLRLETLGALRLTGAGCELLKGRRKELVLLAFLTRQAPRHVSRQELASLLWEDASEARSRASLRQALLQLKRVLGDQLATPPDAAGLPVDAVELDLAAFEADAVAGRVSAGLERWKGDFLPGAETVGGEAFREWLEAEREGFRRRLVPLLERALRQAEQEGDHAGAVRWSDRWTAGLPYDERGLICRCELLVRRGEHAAALAAHGGYVSRIRTHLDVEPAAEVVRLGVALSAAAGSAVPAIQSAALLAPELVGRASALATLRGAWGAVRAGKASFVLVEGDHGIGKTRLCEELVREVRGESESATILRCRAAPGDRQDPWATARRLLEPLHAAAGTGAASAASLAEVAELIPSFHERFPHLPAPARRIAALEQAILQVLAATAAETPLLLVVDEVPRADERTTAMLSRLASASLPGVLLVLAARTEELELLPELRELGSLASRLKLQPLSPLQIENLVDSMLTLPPDQRRSLSDHLSAEAAGNPFYTVELITGLADTHLLVMDLGGAWSLGPRFFEGATPLPSTIREAVHQRLQQISPGGRQVAAAAAVLGRQADGALLEEVAGLSPPDLARAEKELLARRILREIPGPSAGYAFGHDLVRRVAYESLSPAERQLLHRAAASALQRRPREAIERGDLEFHRKRGTAPARPRRWRRIAAAAMLAGAVGSGAWALVRAPATDLDSGPPRLLVLAFTNETGDPSLNALGRIAADWLSQSIAKTGLVRVMPPGFEPADSQDAGAHLTRVRALAASARADLVIWGSYYWSGDSLQIQADLADLHRSEPLLALGNVRTGSHNPMPAVEVLRQKTLAVLASQLDPRLAAAAAVQSTPPSYEAYQEFSEGLDYWYRREGPDALPHFMRAYALDTTYSLPLIYAIDVHRGSGRPMMVDSLVRMLIPRRAELAPYDRAVLDLHAAVSPAAKYLAARAAAVIAPGSPIAANDLPMLALMLNRPAEALEHLTRIDTDRGEGSRLPVYWARLSAATHLLGKYDRQLEAGEQVRRRFPTDNRSYFYKVRALAAMGRLGELDAVLGESLQLEANVHWGSSALPLHALAFDELTAHGYPEHALVVLERAREHFERAPAALQKLALHRFEMARVLYRLGRFDESRRLLEQVLAEGGAVGASEALIRGEIGIVAAHQGDLAVVERMDHWLTETAAPHLNGRNTEYRAKFAAVLGRKAEAMRLLQQSSSEGYGFGLERHQAPEYQGLRGYRPFDEFLRPKG